MEFAVRFEAGSACVCQIVGDDIQALHAGAHSTSGQSRYSIHISASIESIPLTALHFVAHSAYWFKLARDGSGWFVLEPFDAKIVPKWKPCQICIGLSLQQLLHNPFKSRWPLNCLVRNVTATLPTPAIMPGMSQISGSSPAFKRLEPLRTSEAFADFNALILLLTGAPHQTLGETLSSLGRDKTSGRIEGDPKKDRSEKADVTNQNMTPPLQVELAQPLPIQLARGQLTIAAAAGSGPGALLKRESQSGPGVAPDTSLTGPAAPSPPAFTVAGHPSPPSIPTRTGDVPPNGIRGGTAGLAPLAFAAELTEIYPSMGRAAAVAEPLDPTAVGKGLTESPDGLTIAEPVFGSNQTLAAPLSTLAASISVPLQRSPKAIGERTLVKSPPSYLNAPGFDLESALSKTSDARTPPKGQATEVNALSPIPQNDSRGASGQVSPNKEKSASTPLSIQSGNILASENGGNFSHSLSEMVAEKPPSGRADAPGTHDSPKLESKSEINPNLRPPPAREISLRLPGSGESGSVDLRISERAGKVQIAVRTLDAGLARALRSDISDLVGRLERKGFDAQTWLPPERSGHGTVETQNGSTSEHGGSRQSGNGWQTAADPQQQRQRNRPRWLDEMEAKNSDQDGSSNEGEEE